MPAKILFSMRDNGSQKNVICFPSLRLIYRNFNIIPPAREKSWKEIFRKIRTFAEYFYDCVGFSIFFQHFVQIQFI